MGTRIIVPNADFSARGLGNINRYYQLLELMGTTSPTWKAAFKTFYNGFEAAGFPTRFVNAYTFGGGSVQADQLDIITGLSAGQLTFSNDTSGSHTQSGYQSAKTPSRAGVSNFAPTQFTNFSLHAYNVTAVPTSETATLVGINTNTGGDYVAKINRNSDGQWEGSIDKLTGNTVVQSGSLSYANSLGLKTVSITGGTVRNLYIDGILRGTNTKSIAPIFGGAATMAIGGLGGGGVPIGNFNGFMRFSGWTNTVWTQDDENTLKALLDAFNTALA